MKKTILFIFYMLIAFNLYAQDALQKIRINDFTGGLVTNTIPEVIEVNQCASCVNVVINKRGQISKRKGQDLFNEDVGSTAFTGLGRFDPDTSTSYMVVASGTRVMRSGATDTSWASTSTIEVLTTGKDTEFVQANDLLFIMNGTDYTSWYDGSAWFTGLGVAQGSPPTATTAVWLRNYLFTSGNPTQPDWVYYSDNLSPEEYTITSLFRVNTGDGQAVNKMMAFRLNELIIYKERSVYVLDITGTTPLSDWTLQPISKVVGCVAPRSVVSLGNDQWFLSSEPIAVRSLVRSEYDKILVDMVSKDVQDYFDGTGETVINKAQISKATAVLFDNKYIIAFPTGTSSVNNTILVYDFIVEGWYEINGWFPSSWIVYDKRLFYTDANDGRVIEVFKNTVGDFQIGPTIIDSASTPTAAIAFTYSSPSIDFDNPENYKELDAIELEFDTTGNYDAKLYINIDNDGWTDVGNINLAGDVVTLPVNLPFTLTSGGVARKTYQLQRYGEFKKIQVRVVQNGLSESVKLQRITIFALKKPWRRE